MTPEDLEPDLQKELEELVTGNSNTELLQLSCITQEGVQQVKNAACDRLIADRVAAILKAGQASQAADATTPTGRLGDLLARIHVAQPIGGIVRETFVPDAVKNGTHKKFSMDNPDRRKLERELEDENGGPGVYNLDMKRDYDLADSDWNHDKVPEFFNGRNVADYVDPDIEEKLAQLEAEEEKLEAEGYYDESDSMEDADDANLRMKAELIRDKRTMIRNDSRLRKSLRNRAIIPRAKKTRTIQAMGKHLVGVGLDASEAIKRAKAKAALADGRSQASSLPAFGKNGDAMDVDPSPADRLKLSLSSRAPKTNRLTDGLGAGANRTGVTDPVARRDKAERITKLNQRKMNRMARQGEGDRHQTVSLLAHLVKGKRGMGKTRSR